MLPTSYFSFPSTVLDQTIFQGETIRPEIRAGLLNPLVAYFSHGFHDAQEWLHAWLAGSGASYQWAAARDPGDLDILLGVNFVKFRQHNPGFVGFSDNDIAQFLNENLRHALTEHMRDWNGYDVTYFVNPDSENIENIHPYAAYSLTDDEWTVRPDPNQQPPMRPDWEQRVQGDARMARDIVTRYGSALNAVKMATNPAHRMNAEVRLRAVLEQASTLFEDIHLGRRQSFSRIGHGYAGWGNYRWQAGKSRGTVQALRDIHDYRTALVEEQAHETYGVELPDTDTLIRRAAMVNYFNGEF